jgi:hypothetical protein
MAIGTMTSCGDDACRHEQRLGAAVALRELLAEQGQHRCVGEMKKCDRGGEDQQRLEFQNDPQTARLAIAVLVGPAGEIMIDRAGADREHGENARRPECRDEPQHGTGRHKPAGNPGGDRGKGVSGVVESLVAADPAGEQPAPDDAEGNGPGRRRKHGVGAPD